MTASSPYRPTIAVTQHAISAGHYLAATAGFDILQAGGNAIDAGCAAGIALGVLQSDLVDVAGVAPIMIYLTDRQEVVTIAGLGPWPKALDPELFMREHAGKIPKGVLAHEKFRIERLRPGPEAGDCHYLLLVGDVDHDRRNPGDIDEIALEHTERNPGGTTGIDGVAASLQDVKTGGGSQIMARRDRMLCYGDGRPMRR